MHLLAALSLVMRYAGGARSPRPFLMVSQPHRFDVYTAAMLKSARSVIQVQDVLPLLDEASKLAPDATGKERSRFAKAGNSLRFKAYVVKNGGDPAMLD